MVKNKGLKDESELKIGKSKVKNLVEFTCWHTVDFDFAEGKVEIVDFSFVTDVKETAWNC